MSFNLHKICETDLRVDSVTEYKVFEQTAKRIIEGLSIENLNLSETMLFASPQDVYNKTIAKSYRMTRESLEQMGELGKKQSLIAVKQARKLLYMKPQVQRGNMPDIKALAIKDWNYKLGECLKEALLNEYGLAHDQALEIAKNFINKSLLKTVSDVDLKHTVLELGKAIKRHIIKTVDNMYRVVLYRLKDVDYVAIEAPGKKPEVYQ